MSRHTGLALSTRFVFNVRGEKQIALPEDDYETIYG